MESVIGETSASTPHKTRSPPPQPRKINKPCMYWKNGKCNKGDKCMFRHDGPPGKPSGPPRPPPRNEPPSAATPVKDGKPRSPSPAPKRQPSRGRSRSKDKGRTAACCISYALAAPTKRQVRVNPKPEVRHIDVEGKRSPHLTRKRRYSDRRDLTQAIEAAKELEAIVEASIAKVQVPCNFECSDFGLTCQHCEKLCQLSCPAHNAGLEFLAGTGSEEDLISRSDHELYYPDVAIESASKHVSLMTANGSIQGDRSVTLSMPMIGQWAECDVLESTPPVCSVGRRCMDEGFEFHWYPGQPPYFIAPTALPQRQQDER